MRDLKSLNRDFAQARREMEKVVKNLPRFIGVEATKIVKENFVLQSYDTGNGLIRWPKRKESTNAAYDRGRTSRGQKRGRNSTYKGSVYSSRNPLLRQTLALYNSIQYKANGKMVFIGTSLSLVPYAKVHNEGSSKMPRRQFMPYGGQGANPKIIKRVKKIIEFEEQRAMRLFKR